MWQAIGDWSTAEFLIDKVGNKQTLAFIQSPVVPLLLVGAGLYLIFQSFRGIELALEKIQGENVASYDPAAVLNHDVVLTPEQLENLVSGKTQVQMKGIVQPYLGQYITVTGTVTDVRTWFEDQLNIELEWGENSIVALTVTEQHRAFASTLHKGAQITVRGKIQDFSRRWLRLVDCAITRTA